MMPTPSPTRMRVAVTQYFVRPIARLEQFEDQVAAVVEVARGYKCRLFVLPEYFTMQLVTLQDVHRPMSEQVRDVATYRERFIEMTSGLARSAAPGFRGAGRRLGLLRQRSRSRDYAAFIEWLNMEVAHPGTTRGEIRDIDGFPGSVPAVLLQRALRRNNSCCNRYCAV